MHLTVDKYGEQFWAEYVALKSSETSEKNKTIEQK